jgi:hypothetical protein
MRRWVFTALIVILGLEIAAPAFAARRTRVVHHGPHGRRTTVIVHRNFPVHRRLPVVVVRPVRTRVVVAPAVFLAPVVWTAAVVSAPPAQTALVWEDAETLSKDDDWTEFTLGADRQGRKLYVEIAGKAQLNFAEVVFANGETQVVDFEDKTRETGLYSLLDFADGRKVDHVRMVARARSDEARIILRMS